MGEFSTEIGSLPLSGNVGVRYVRTKQSSTGLSTLASGTTSTTATRTYDDTLPSFNLVAEVTPDFLIRLGAAKVMTRPGLGSLTPGATVAVAGGARTISSGNPNLDPTRATNVDLGFEWYFAEDPAREPPVHRQRPARRSADRYRRLAHRRFHLHPPGQHPRW
ncbi:hypothetical protein G6F31_019029 [Rhizopus arrhizus]|nr:hypothetical protein G6F31_019029 [Rhizopus arrhizus]